MGKRRRVDLEDMTDDEVRDLVAEAIRRERWMPGAYSVRRRGWSVMRARSEAELERRSRLARPV